MQSLKKVHQIIRNMRFKIVKPVMILVQKLGQPFNWDKTSSPSLRLRSEICGVLLEFLRLIGTA